jgi:hypothetical protein
MEIVNLVYTCGATTFAAAWILLAEPIWFPNRPIVGATVHILSGGLVGLFWPVALVAVGALLRADVAKSRSDRLVLR